LLRVTKFLFFSHHSTQRKKGVLCEIFPRTIEDWAVDYGSGKPTQVHIAHAVPLKKYFGSIIALFKVWVPRKVKNSEVFRSDRWLFLIFNPTEHLMATSQEKGKRK